MDGFSDLAFFATVVKHGSLAAAAQQLGVTPPAVSKRLAAIERRLGVRLLQRTTRRIGLTPEGETYVVDGARVLAELEALERAVTGSRAEPKGLLRISATLGFGRQHVAPLLSTFARRFPEVELQLQLGDRPVNLVEQGFDLQVRLGELPDARLTARLLARNRRVLCASPSYLRRAGEPTTPRELARHACLFIRESEETYGSWHLEQGSRSESVKVRGPLAANDGESVLGWALDGHGILMRSLWEAAPMLRSGRLRPVLADWQLPPADIYAVFPTRAHLSAKTRALVDWLLDGLAESGATWQVLAQQVMLMRREFPAGTHSMDSWDGYPAARARLLQGLRDRGAANAVVLTGDVHAAWAGDVRLDPLDEASPVVATEFVASSISSGGDGTETLGNTAEVLRRNPHIRFFNNRRGYTLHEMTAERMEVQFRALPYVTRAGAPREDRGRFVIEAGRPGLQPG